MPGYLGRFIDSLAQRFAGVTCFLHEPFSSDQPGLLDYSIRSANVRFISMGVTGSVPARMLRTRSYADIVKENMRDLDVFLLRGPSPLLPVIAHALNGIPKVFLIVGDYRAGIDDSPQPGWRKQAIRLWAYWNRWQQLRAAQYGLTFVNSRKLYREMQPVIKNLYETRTTTLEKEDFYQRPDTCVSSPYHLLYTGRLEHSKGLLELIDAISLLVNSGEEVVFDLVGWYEKGDPIMDEVSSLAEKRGVSKRVRYHGYKAVGPELFAYYKGADIYWIASRSSEGFPRTIWEAMAHSLPVVATQVGSIQDYIQGKAELVLPGQPEALAQAVRRLIHEPELRQHHIREGFTLAQQNTLESQVGLMVDRIEEWLIHS